MNVAILGGGFTGLAASYYIQQKGHSITLFEKEDVLGGFAAGFKEPGWNWYLDRSYHHLFINDYDILDFAKDIDFSGVGFYQPVTASLYKDNNNYRIIPVDTPQDFLNFPFLSMTDKIRASIILAFLKLSPFLSIYEKTTAKEFLKKTMGERSWIVLWEELFRKKFGKYAGNILASFIWARIKKRSKKLGYPDGGFQNFINHAEKQLIRRGITIIKGKSIGKIAKLKNQFIVNGKNFDVVISTLPTSIFIYLASDILPNDYRTRLSKLSYLNAVNYIFESDDKLLDKTYWLSAVTNESPFMVFVQHTNLVSNKNYGNKNIGYIGRYLDLGDKLFTMNKNQIRKIWMPYLEKVSGKKISINKDYLFKASFAQPIFNKRFALNKPDFITPVKNLYCANLDMTYPYDRGTNYAVAIGKKAAELI